MKDLLKKHKLVLISAVVAVAVLVIAFFAGGTLSDNTKTVVSSSASTSDTENYTEAETVSETVAETTSSDNKTEKKEQKNKDKKKTESKTDSSQTKNSTNEVVKKEKQSSNTIVSGSDKSSAKSNNISSRLNQSSSSMGNKGQKDKYLTDPIPEGKPKPVEPQEQETKNNIITCTFSISCSTILDNIEDLDPPDKIELVPDDGWILKPTKVEFKDGESVFDVLQRVCKDNNIHMEFSFTPIYNSAYIEGINNLYEFDCGSNSGWMYSVNDWYPNYGCSRYVLQDGDVVEWKYTCDLGYDIGGSNAIGN